MKFPKLAILTCFLLLLASVNLAADSGPVIGTVAETIDAGGYTYIRIKESDTWIATSTLEVSEGTQVQYSGGTEMKDFHSKALDRTFESIWFVGNVSASGQDLQKLHHDSAKSQASAPTPMRKPTGPAPGEIEKLDGGKVIEEIFADRVALDGQEVSLRAKVVKVSPRIMGKNWITLQDGTGMDPHNKLTATSAEMVAVGETVTAQGIIRNDVDLGYGYHYEALLEETTFSK